MSRQFVTSKDVDGSKNYDPNPTRPQPGPTRDAIKKLDLSLRFPWMIRIRDMFLRLFRINVNVNNNNNNNNNTNVVTTNDESSMDTSINKETQETEETKESRLHASEEETESRQQSGREQQLDANDEDTRNNTHQQCSTNMCVRVCDCVAGSDVRLPPRGASWISCKG
ncbi:hypothetical protein WR25_19559 [Diploscapter pachys]|uniref:Uncharacterized protein n=1 Tax=Diploscapter pachys TaxID=2018661 RepID=A0A2A2JED6_9BILA|nr:hypothetical protein WR25_19559 [Diploscapter pachys]